MIEKISNLPSQVENLLQQNEDLRNQVAQLKSQNDEFRNQLDEMRWVLPRLVLRAEAGGSIANMPWPFDVPISDIPFKIGFSGNLLNNHYTYCQIARRMGCEAFLLLDPKFQDLLITGLPVWEEVEWQVLPGVKFEINEVPQLKDWKDPFWVRRVEWNLKHLEHYSRLNVSEARLLLENYGFVFDTFTLHEYMRYYQASAHLELLGEFNQMDILQVCGTHVGVASYSQKPYVVFYFGADVLELPFFDNDIGAMQVRGIKRANMHIAQGRCREYLIAQGIPPQKIVSLPFMMDTDRYSPHMAPPENLKEQFAGKKVIYLGSRQHWIQKGNDKLFRALKLLSRKRDDFICPTLWHGTDVARSEALVKELGIERFIHRCGLQSKKNMRDYFAVCDVVVGHFTMGLTGTFILEAMSCGKPVVSYVNKQLFESTSEATGGDYASFPIVSAFQPEEIAEKLDYLLDHDAERSEIRSASRKWIEQYHGYKRLWPLYKDLYLRVIRDSGAIKY